MTTTQPSTALATVAQPQVPDVLTDAWPAGQYLSPLALFDPQRINTCAQYHVALLDNQSSEAKAHLAAAQRHLQEALKLGGLTPARHWQNISFDLNHMVGCLGRTIDNL